MSGEWWSDLALIRRHQRGNRVRQLVLMLVIVGVGIGLVGFWRWLASKVRDEAEPVGTLVQFPKLNCQLIKPEAPWQDEDSGGIRRSLKADLVMRRTAPSAWLALLVKDYKDRIPPDGEVREEVIRRLGSYFTKEGLEWEQQKEATLANLPAQRLVFRGEVDNQATSGECLILVHQGLAYGLLSWAPAEEAAGVQAELDALRKRLALMGDRKEWQEKRPSIQTFRGSQIGYTLHDKQGIWQKWTPATDYDPKAVLALVARERREPGSEEDKNPMIAAAVLLVALRQPTANLDAAVKAARAYLESQQKPLYPETRVESLSDQKNVDRAGRIGTVAGQLMTVRVINAETRQRFLLLGVVHQPDQIVILQCECAWESRAAWEGRFRQLLGTFRLGNDQDTANANQGREEVER